MTFNATEKNLAQASILLKAMGNHRRLHILCLLAVNERRVGELEELVGLSQSALSQHLARLRRDRLVKTRRQAQTIFYSLAGNDVRAVLAALDHMKDEPAMVASAAPFGPPRAPATIVR